MNNAIVVLFIMYYIVPVMGFAEEGANKTSKAYSETVRIASRPYLQGVSEAIRVFVSECTDPKESENWWKSMVANRDAHANIEDIVSQLRLTRGEPGNNIALDSIHYYLSFPLPVTTLTDNNITLSTATYYRLNEVQDESFLVTDEKKGGVKSNSEVTSQSDMVGIREMFTYYQFKVGDRSDENVRQAMLNGNKSITVLIVWRKAVKGDKVERKTVVMPSLLTFEYKDGHWHSQTRADGKPPM